MLQQARDRDFLLIPTRKVSYRLLRLAATNRQSFDPAVARIGLRRGVDEPSQARECQVVGNAERQSKPFDFSVFTHHAHAAALSIGHFSIDFWQGCFPAITALLAVGRGYSYTTVGILVLAFNLASSVIQPVFGRIADKRSAQWLMAFGLSIAGVGVVLIGMTYEEAVSLKGNFERNSSHC